MGLDRPHVVQVIVNGEFCGTSRYGSSQRLAQCGGQKVTTPHKQLPHWPSAAALMARVEEVNPRFPTPRIGGEFGVIKARDDNVFRSRTIGDGGDKDETVFVRLALFIRHALGRRVRPQTGAL